MHSFVLLPSSTLLFLAVIPAEALAVLDIYTSGASTDSQVKCHPNYPNTCIAYTFIRHSSGYSSSTHSSDEKVRIYTNYRMQWYFVEGVTEEENKTVPLDSDAFTGFAIGASIDTYKYECNVTLGQGIPENSTYFTRNSEQCASCSICFSDFLFGARFSVDCTNMETTCKNLENGCPLAS